MSKRKRNPIPPKTAIQKQLITIKVPEHIQGKIAVLNQDIEKELALSKENLSEAINQFKQAESLKKDAQIALAKAELAIQFAENKKMKAENEYKLLELKSTDPLLYYDAIVAAAGYNPKDRLPELNNDGEILVMV